MLYCQSTYMITRLDWFGGITLGPEVRSSSRSQVRFPSMIGCRQKHPTN